MIKTNLSFKDGPYPALVGVVTTMHKGVVNAAPITWFTPCSYDPPLMFIAVKKGKDTFTNILEGSALVLQTVPFQYAQEVHNLAESLPRDQSEVEKVGLDLVQSTEVAVPRLKIAQEWFECVVTGFMHHKLGLTHNQLFCKVLVHGGKSRQEPSLCYCGERLYTGHQFKDVWQVRPYGGGS